MAADTILFTYKAPKLRQLTDEDPEKGIAEQAPPHHPGVPLRDLTLADVESLPAWLHNTIAASDLYDATPAGTRWHTAAAKARAPGAEAEAAPAPELTKTTANPARGAGAEKE
jgi:hypothetical protein